MLEKEKQQNRETFKSLFIEQKQHQVVESELAKTRKALHDRAVFLERLQSCITEGPANDKLAAEQKRLEEERAALEHEREELKKAQQEFAKNQASLLSREDYAHRQQETIEKAMKNEEKTRAFLEQRAKRVKEHAAKLRKAETDLAERLERLNKREEDLARRERELASTIQDVRGQQARFAEIREQQRQALAKDEGEMCAQLTGCSACVANPRCGWCAATADGLQGTCLTHNVNAVADGLTSGQCTIQNWYSKVSDRLTALNLNVFGGDLADKEQRAAALFNVIISAKYPDFVALQEVAPWFVNLLKDQAWFKNYYHATEFNGPVPPGGLMILSRFPINGTAYYESYTPQMHAEDQRPKLLLATINLSGKEITVGTTTLDWRNSESRVTALKFIDGITRNIDNFVFMGDFNFDDGAQPETANVPTSWMDLWPHVHNVTAGAPDNKITRGPNRYGFTWDPRSNWYARYSDVNSRPSRIDRIFLRSTIMMPREIHLVGCPGPDYLCQDPPPNPNVEKIPFQRRLNQVEGNVVYPSSHYGLLASFSMFIPHC